MNHTIVHAITGKEIEISTLWFPDMPQANDIDFSKYCSAIDERIVPFLKSGALLFGGITRRYFANIPPVRTDIDLIFPHPNPPSEILSGFGFTSITEIHNTVGDSPNDAFIYRIFRKQFRVFACHAKTAYSLLGNTTNRLPVHLLIPKHNTSNIHATIDFDVNGIIVGYGNDGFFLTYPTTAIANCRSRRAKTLYIPPTFRGDKLLAEGFALLP
jgi:hypothetical protein